MWHPNNERKQKPGTYFCAIACLSRSAAVYGLTPVCAMMDSAKKTAAAALESVASSSWAAQLQQWYLAFPLFSPRGCVIELKMRLWRLGCHGGESATIADADAFRGNFSGKLVRRWRNMHGQITHVGMTHYCDRTITGVNAWYADTICACARTSG